MSDLRAITPESPWLGLSSFTEDARGYFFGRDREVNDLYERVIHRPLTIFFGQSGLGKTSLLRAGLVPRLRETGFLPILLRLDWVTQGTTPEEQVLAAMREGLRAAKDPRWQALAAFSPAVSLWRLLHDRAHGFVAGPDGPAAPRPVLLFDQFEEVFTLGQRRRTWADQWRDTLAALVENRPPADLRAQLQENSALLDQLDLRARPAKVVLTLRHDFLHLIERWRRTMPSLLDNRLELKHLSGRQALQAVLYPGQFRPGKPPIIDEATGRAIVRFVAGSPGDKPLKDIEAVPPLLSLVCAELNNERRKHGLDRIVYDSFAEEPAPVREYLVQLPLNAAGQRDPVPRVTVEHALVARGLSRDEIGSSLTRLAAKGVVSVSTDPQDERISVSPGFLESADRSGHDILQIFYDSCFAGMHGAVRAWLEETFLSPEGFRQSVNLDAALGSLARTDVTTEEAAGTLDTLVERRILTAEEYGEVRRFELTHDILAPIVRKSRDVRRTREAEEAARRKRQEAEDAARAQELYALSTRGLRPQPFTDASPRRAQLRNVAPDDSEWGKRLNLSEYFWDDLLTYMEEGTVIPVLGRELVTVMVGGHRVSLDRSIAESVASRLDVRMDPSSTSYTLNDVARTYIAAGGDPTAIYRHVLAAVGAAAPEPSQSMVRIAEIAAFRLYVSLTFDAQLESALESVRGRRAEVIAYSPGDPRDLPADHDWSGIAVVYHLLGRLSATPDFVVSDEDLLEFFYALQNGSRQPDLLFDELRSSHLLMLGCALPDWLARLFVRMTQGLRPTAQTHRIVVVESQPDPGFERFTQHFRPNTQVIPAAPDEFIDELFQRWQERQPRATASPPPPVRSSMPPGSVYLSYAAEDQPVVDHIRNDLARYGVTVWSLHGAETGKTIDERIRRDIADCACFMPIISRVSASREQVRREWAWASERALGLSYQARFILPVLADETRLDETDVPESFRGPHVIRLEDRRLPSEAGEQIRQLVRDYHRRHTRGRFDG